MKAIVTGASGGLGYAFTKYLNDLGYEVYALYNTHKLEDFGNVKFIKCDIKNEEEIISTLDNIGNFDLLINNAALSIDNLYQDVIKNEFMDVLETNVVGTFLMIKHSVKYVQNGVVINISSDNTFGNNSKYSITYDTSKAGINMLTLDYAESLENIKVFGVAPGWINTDPVMEMNPLYLEEEMKKNNQDKLLDKDILAKYIIDNIDTFDNGEIRVIKEV